jgi:glycosyltransferase involved in cell wall biosynthesis
MIDISIVTFNSSKWLDKFFLSLINQSISSQNFNIFICDNGSNDNTLLLCDEFKKKYAAIFNKIVITKNSNQGFGAGHNLNLSKASAEFFLVTNVDLEFEKDAIEQILKYVQESSSNVASWEFRQKPYEHPKYYNPVTLETKWSSSACILFKRDALLKVGGYESRIFMYGEDVELSYRLRDQGYILQYCPKAVCWHYTYEVQEEVKPLQFYGSKLANVYIRLRYGSYWQIVSGFFLYFCLFIIPTKIKHNKINLFKNLIILVKNTPYFLKTRKKSNLLFPINFWDYEICRKGAFYKYSSIDLEELPLVSIIIRTYNERIEFLKEAVKSVQNQTYQNIELIIVEDGSNFDEIYANELENSNIFAKIKYVSIPKSGRCIAGNVGLENATGEFINFLDDDDLFFADHVEVLVNELVNNPNIGAVYSIAFETRIQILNKNPLKYIERDFNVPYAQKFSRVELWQRNYLPIQSVLFRKKLFLEHGGFDKELEYLEDWNLWTRYSLNCDFLLIEKLTTLYRVPADNKIFIARQKKLVEYYPIALKKQQLLYSARCLGVHQNILDNAKTNSKLTLKLRNIINKFLMKMPEFCMFVRHVRYKINKIFKK